MSIVMKSPQGTILEVDEALAEILKAHKYKVVPRGTATGKHAAPAADSVADTATAAPAIVEQQATAQATEQEVQEVDQTEPEAAAEPVLESAAVEPATAVAPAAAAKTTGKAKK